MLKNIGVKVAAGLVAAGLVLGGSAAASAEGRNCMAWSVWGGGSGVECELSSSAFRDVSIHDEFAVEINWLYTQGISKGWGDGLNAEYRPNAEIKRDAMIVFLYRVAGSPDYTPPKVSPFRDVSTSNVFYKEIAWAYENGIANGWGSGSSREFRPYEPVKRDAVAAFLYRFAGANSSSTDSPFSDVPADHIFAKEIAWMSSTAVANGWSDGTFRPDATTRRDAMAAFLYRGVGAQVIPFHR